MVKDKKDFAGVIKDFLAKKTKQGRHISKAMSFEFIHISVQIEKSMCFVFHSKDN